MHEWNSTLRATQKGLLLLVTSEAGGSGQGTAAAVPEPPAGPAHGAGGAGLWRGQALRVAVSAGACSVDWAGSGLFGDELYPAESPLVRFHVVHPASRERLPGVGDFRQLRRGDR